MNTQALAGLVLGSTITLLVLVLIWATHAVRASRKVPAAAPRPILADNPPHYALYAQQADDPKLTCSCHGQALVDGDRILIWPTEEILCELTYRQDGLL